MPSKAHSYLERNAELIVVEAVKIRVSPVGFVRPVDEYRESNGFSLALARHRVVLVGVLEVVGIRFAAVAAAAAVRRAARRKQLVRYCQAEPGTDAVRARVGERAHCLVIHVANVSADNSPPQLDPTADALASLQLLSVR